MLGSHDITLYGSASYLSNVFPISACCSSCIQPLNIRFPWGSALDPMVSSRYTLFLDNVIIYMLTTLNFLSPICALFSAQQTLIFDTRVCVMFISLISLIGYFTGISHLAHLKLNSCSSVLPCPLKLQTHPGAPHQ